MSQPLAVEASRFLVAAGYDSTNLATEYRYTWRTDDGALTNGVLPLVAFAERPFTLRSACVSVAEVQSDDEARTLLAQMTYLSTPIAIIGTTSRVTIWSVRRELEPSEIQHAKRTDWTTTLQTRLSDIGPDSVISAKRGASQLTFVDLGLAEWAERITGETLVRLLEVLLADSLKYLPESLRTRAAAQRSVVRLVFQLFACRVLQDKQVIPDATDPETSLHAAHDKFSENIDPGILKARYVSTQLVEHVHLELRRRFAFASLTTEMLGQAYESALVSPQFRKEQGIYYTPASITRYIVGRLPIESIEQEDRIFLDPSCGSGSFLLAGFERLNGLLPRGWAAGLRHQYLRSRIVGLDTDSFAREVAVLSLLITDLHNRNGWKIWEGDVEAIDVKGVGGRRPTIIATNPPFKEVKKGTRREFAADVLVRLLKLLAPGGLMGIVLPQSVLESKAGREAREAMLNEQELLEIATFPGGVFHSNADTAIVCLRKPHPGNKRFAAVSTVRELRAQDLGRFDQLGVFTRTYSVETDVWRQDPDKHFTISPLIDPWKQLENTSKHLDAIAEVRTGLRVKSVDQSSVSRAKRSGDVPFVDRLNILRPYALLADVSKSPRWLKYGPQLDRPRDRRIFDQAKVLVNSNRNPGSPWRLVAAAAPKGLFFSENFYGVLPRNADVSFEEIVAVLNSPVANAWADAHTRGRKIVVRTLETMPFPIFDKATSALIVGRVRRLEGIVRARWKGSDGLFVEDEADDTRITALQAELDEIIYDAYRLTLQQRREVDQVMRAGKRPQ